ncbi:MAG: sulfotransferase family protein [Acidobacteriota bacterium]|nr:sulfotransferase family protein [Acidobacteriota bacterium]
MANPLSSFLRKLKYGDDVIVVSGLPRSGTSMMMKMLDAAALSIMTDNERAADEDNPKGYFEYARVKDLKDEADKSWVREARGQVLKVISHLLETLPDENFYRVILVRRDFDEIIASQNKMLERRGEENQVADSTVKEAYIRHLVDIRYMVRRRPNFEMIEVQFMQAMEAPRIFATDVNKFLGGNLDVESMMAVVDLELYRNRKRDVRADTSSS